MLGLDNLVTIKETFKLPSKGRVYGVPVNEEITLRSMTNAEDMMISGYAENEYKRLCEVIEECIVGEKPAVHVYDMIFGDFEYLLHKLRIVTYGSKYPIVMKCPNCGELIQAETSLDDIEVHEFDEKEIGDREIELPQTKIRVKLCFSTPKAKDIAKEKAKEFKKKRKTSGVNYDLLFEAISYIYKIDDESPNDFELEQSLMKFPAKDIRYLVEKGRELDRKVGLDTLTIAKCPECNAEVLTRFQYQPEFLNPTVS